MFRSNNESMVYKITKQTTADETFAHFGEHELKKPFYLIYYLYKMKQSHWLLCAAKKCDWSRKVVENGQN